MTTTNTSRQAASPRPRPVLMIPLRRCGSHALRLRLNFSPAFFSPYPLHIVDFMPLLPLYGDLDNDSAYFKLVVDVIGLQSASMVKWPGVVFDPIEIFNALVDQPRSVHRITWELLLRAGEHQGARLVMDKSLDSVHYADELMTLLPDMLFLNVVRDPRAQVASMTKAIIHDFDPGLNALTWVDAHRAGRLLAAKHPDRVLTIRFEDFVANQEHTLRRICAFFEIDFLPQMLDVSASKEAREIAQMSDLWSSNCFAPIAANRDKFKSQLSMDEIRLIETLAREAMQHYGYEFMTDAQAEVPDAMAWQARQQRSTELRQRAWHEMVRNNPRDYLLRRFRADYLSRTRAGLEQLKAETMIFTPPVREPSFAGVYGAH